MANSLRHPLLALTSKYIAKSTKSFTNSCTRFLTAPHIATRGLSTRRNWQCLPEVGSKFNRFNRGKVLNHLCGCRSYSSDTGNLESFLKKEIIDEQKSDQPRVTSIEGWDVNKDGTRVTLNKKYMNETITVEFDVNNSVDVEPSYEEDGDPSSPPNMVSRPDFIVEIKKGSGKKMKFLCEFQNPYEDMGDPDDNNVADQFSIVDVRMDDAEDKFFSLSSSVMDADMYELLMDMLDERGLDDDFMNNLIDFSTTYEHDLYIKFLKDMKDFVASK